MILELIGRSMSEDRTSWTDVARALRIVDQAGRLAPEGLTRQRARQRYNEHPIIARYSIRATLARHERRALGLRAQREDARKQQENAPALSQDIARLDASIDEIESPLDARVKPLREERDQLRMKQRTPAEHAERITALRDAISEVDAIKKARVKPLREERDQLRMKQRTPAEHAERITALDDAIVGVEAKIASTRAELEASDVVPLEVDLQQARLRILQDAADALRLPSLSEAVLAEIAASDLEDGMLAGFLLGVYAHASSAQQDVTADLASSFLHLAQRAASRAWRGI